MKKMKKNYSTLFMLIGLVFITSCSKSDDSPSTPTISNKAYCNVTLLGETLHDEYEEGYTVVYGLQSCIPNSPVSSPIVGQFDKSNYFLNILFVHKDRKSQFVGYNLNNTTVKSNFDISTCFNNFDLIVEFDSYSPNSTLTFNNSSSNINQIEDITLYSEDDLEIIYVVKGNFQVTYKKPDNSLIPVTGDYRTFIYVKK